MSLGSKFIGKKILFLSVQTFDLQREIKEKLEELGAEVYYFDERPANNNFTKGIIRLKPSLLKKKIKKYYSSIFKKISEIKFDYLFVNRGEIVPKEFILKFKSANPNCKSIFYTWDSFKNNPNPIDIIELFDRKFTFDSEDAEQKNINFRPLFYLQDFSKIKGEGLDSNYNLLFLGTAHSDRYKLSSEINNWCLKNNLSTYCYYYMQGRFVYFFKKFFDRSFKEFDFKKLSFISLNKNQILNLYKQSNCILDIHHPWQKGLTMRTIEAIGAGKKLITTNAEIKRYSFYNPANILVIDREKIDLNLDFFRSKYQEIDQKIYERLSLEGWLNCIFFEDESDIWIAEIK